MQARCPQCDSPLDVDDRRRAGISCTACGTSLVLTDGILTRLLPADSVGLSTAAPDIDRTPPFVPQSAAGDRRETALPPSFGDYDILEEIARGGMGVIYKARHVPLNRIVALKLIRSGEFASAAEIARFQTEAEAAAQLDHPNIVPVYEAGRVDGQPYFSMGFVAGESLQQRLSRGPLPAKEAAELIAAVADALQYAHDRGVIHRDMKPSNVLLQVESAELGIENQKVRTRTTPTTLNSQHSTLNPRITDFGIAKRVGSDSALTATGDVMGTPNYMPPEQAAGDVALVGHLSDVYSLGATLYAAITGRPPFQAATIVETLKQVTEREPAAPRDLNPAVDADLETICLMCLRKEPHRRYASAAALADDLRRYLQGRTIVARPVPHWERGWRWCRRNPVTAALAALFVASLVAGVAVAGHFALSAHRRATDLRDALTREQQARKAAERNEQRAQRLFRHALDKNLSMARLAEELKQLAGARSDSVRRILERIQADYDGLLAAGERSPDVLRGKARLLVAFSDVYLELGDSTRALKMVNDARNIADALPKQVAQRDDAVAIRAAADSQLGRILAIRGRPDEALRVLLSARNLWDGLHQRNPGDDAVAEDRGLCFVRLGQVYAGLGNQRASLAAHRDSLAAFQMLADRQPENPRFRSLLAMAFGNRGYAASSLHFYPQSELPDYRRAAEHYRAALKHDPDNPLVWRGYAGLLSNLGWSLKAAGKFPEARSAYDEAGRIARRHSELDPKSVEWKRLVLQVRFQRLDIPDPDRSPTAAAEQRQALQDLHAAAKLAAARDPHDVFRQLDVWRTRWFAAVRRLETAGNDAAGRKVLREILAECETAEREIGALARRFPDLYESTAFLGSAAYSRSVVLARLGNAAQARQAGAMLNQSQLDYFERLHNRYPGEPGWTLGLAAKHNAQYYVLVNAGDLSAAAKHLQRCEDLIAGLLKTDPHNFVWRRIRAKFHSDRGGYFFLQSNLSAAYPEFQNSAQILEQLVREQPKNVDLLKQIAAEYRTLAGKYALLKRPLAEVQAYRKSLDVEQRIFELGPKDRDRDPFQAAVVGSRAVAALGLGAGGRQLKWSRVSWQLSRTRMLAGKDLRSVGEFLLACVDLVRRLRTDVPAEADEATTALQEGLDELLQMQRQKTIHPVHARLIPHFRNALRHFRTAAKAPRPPVVAPRP